jgi:DNA-binding MarR family transcriptional regulator
VVAERLPLSALLSQALVAFTIELDNAWESEMPHRTTRHGGSRRAPYATSLRQWSNFMRVLDDAGLTVGELERRTRSKPHLDGMRRWGYVTVGPDPGDHRERPPERDLLVVPTAAGRHAQAVWRPLPEAIEARWRGRFGAGEVAELRSTLEAVRGQLGLDLPQFLTGLYGGYAANPGDGPVEATEDPLPLSAVLSQVLHAFALEYERESTASLTYTANVLRLLDEDGVGVGDLPRRSGVAIEPIRVALGILAKRGFITVASSPGARGRRARLTGRGLAEQKIYGTLPGEIEARWAESFGPDTIGRLRSLLEALATGSGVERAPLWLGLEPPPGTWRNEVPRPDVLPHFPMPRQSGHPDGA